ncbi:MAG: 2-oxoglutarate dehydrogenase E1 subunit family protein, partial [Catenulispora sp.]
MDEIYQQFLRDPESVDRAWWDFFNDYQPTDSSAAAQALSPSAKVDNTPVTVTSDTSVPAAAAAPTAAAVPAPAPAPAAAQPAAPTIGQQAGQQAQQAQPAAAAAAQAASAPTAQTA